MKRQRSHGRRLGFELRDRASTSPARHLARLEALEDRKMLSGTDLLISTYDSFYGQTVYRFNTTTWTPTAGGLATGAGDNAGTAYGVVAGPDGNYYVSNNETFPGYVARYDASGGFVERVGEQDAMPFSMINGFFTPGTLQFGPNGHLYAADLATNTIYEFDTTSETMQFVNYHPIGFRPGGFTFASDGSNDMIVGSIDNHKITRFAAADDAQTPIFDPADPGTDFDQINVSAVLAKPNNDLIIADFTFGGDELIHHRILTWDHISGELDEFIVLGAPYGTGAYDGFPSQPSTLFYEPGEETFLVGISPDHNLQGTILRFDTDTGAQIGGPVLTGFGTPTGFSYTASIASAVAGRQIFYNNSAFDGNSAAINFTSDASAVATDKSPYLPNDTTAVFNNITSYTKGINGIIVDLAGGGSHTAISASDFVFKVGNNNSPGSWASAPAPASVSVSLGGGVSGSDRVEITWADNSISNKWLEVQVLANANTGLTAADVFFWGNKVGDTGNPSPTDFSSTVSGDGGDIIAHLGAGGSVTNVYDINRTNSVTVSGDRGDVIANLGTITRLKVGSGGPFAPGGGDGDAGIASALTSAASSGSSSNTPAARAQAVTAPRVSQSPGSASLQARLAAIDAALASAALGEGSSHASQLDELLDSLAAGL